MLGKQVRSKRVRSCSQKDLWSSRFGTRLAQQEARLLHPLLRRLHGETVLWIGDQTELSQALGHCMIRMPLQACSPTLQKDANYNSPIPKLQAQCDCLPFATASLDGVVLHHSLENSPDARASVREIERILKPGGRLIICTFNPLSLTGLAALLYRSDANPIAGQSLVNPIRLLDWLVLLNLRLDQRPRFFSISTPRLVRLGESKVRQVFPKFSINNRLTRLSRHATGRLVELASKLIRPLPLGGLIVVSAVKERQGGAQVGREIGATGGRKTKFVLSPSARSEHCG